MIEPKEIRKMVKNVVRRDKGLADQNIMHPARDWYLGLIVAGVLVILGGAYSAYLYTSYESFEFQEDLVPETLVTYRAEQVDKAISVYLQKKQGHEELLRSSTPVQPEITISDESASSTNEDIDTEEETEIGDDGEESVVVPTLSF